MGKKVNYISDIQKALNLITNGVRELQELSYYCKDEGFKAMLFEYILRYAQINYDFSSYLIMKLIEAVKYDKEENEFNDLMKGF